MSRVALFAWMCATAAEGTVQLRRNKAAVASQSTLAAAAPSDVKEVEGASFVRGLEFKHSLRVCNAFPSGNQLEVFRGKEEKLTAEAPMPYKACRDFMSPLKAGDKLEFVLGDQSAGTFSVTDLPNTDAVLFLVVHRHDTASTAVAFESHVFASLASPQVAIIDTYKGSARSSPRIMDGVEGKLQKSGKAGAPGAVALPARSEELRYDSVVALSQGIYEVELDGSDGKVEAKSQLVAMNHESYVVLRMGVEAKAGHSYPQELIIFPSSNPAPLLHSAASSVGVGAAAVLFFALSALA